MKYLILLSITLLLSCKQDDIQFENPEKVYTGMVVGSEKIFEVKELDYFIGNENFEIIGDTDVIYFCDTSAACVLDTNIYYIKEVIDRKIKDQEGDSVFVIERYYSDTKEWDETPDSVWTAKYRHNQFLRTENNQKYAKLVFPISSDLEWDYNAHNAYSNDNTRYSGLRVAFEVDGKMFYDVVVVEKNNNARDDDEIIVNEFLAENYIIEREYYAAGIGLIFKENIQLFNCQDKAIGGFCSSEVFVIAEGKYKIEKLIE